MTQSSDRQPSRQIGSAFFTTLVPLWDGPLGFAQSGWLVCAMLRVNWRASFNEDSRHLKIAGPLCWLNFDSKITQ